MKTLSIIIAIYVDEAPLPSYKFTVLRQHHMNCFDTHVEAEKRVTTINGYYHKETRYNYCVIKEITLQLYPSVIREGWFKWDGSTYSYVAKPVITI